MNFAISCLLVVLIVCLSTRVEATVVFPGSTKASLNTQHVSNSNEIRLSQPSFLRKMSSKVKTVAQAEDKSTGLVKLMIGAGGIYAAFMYYGVLQEDITKHFVGKDGTKFSYTWFIQVCEALANIIVAFIGRQVLEKGGTQNLPMKFFGLAGVAQVCAKSFTLEALKNGLSFPVVTLAKSGKMIPVMAGNIIAGQRYPLRQYISVLAIIAGTCMVSYDPKKAGKGSDSLIGLAFIIASLTCDGINANMQASLKRDLKKVEKRATGWDNMFFSNFFMGITALIAAVSFGELLNGFKYCMENPAIIQKIATFCACSAFGQTFIFYTIANFDTLTVTTVTTTRKVFSVLLSIFLNGHSLSQFQWSGLLVASAAILDEIRGKASHGKEGEEKKKS